MNIPAVKSAVSGRLSPQATQQLMALAALVILYVYFAIFGRRFLSPSTFVSILDSSYYIGFLAIGMTFVIITAGIDLSSGTVMVGSALVGGVAYNVWHLPIAVSLLVVLLTGVLFGVGNGALVGFLHLPPFIATLGMQFVSLGLCAVIAQVQTQTYPSLVSPDGWFKKVLYKANSLPVGIIWLAAFFTLAWFILKRTKLGRYTYAIGSNEEAVELSGVMVSTWKFWVYVLNGFFCGLAGIIYAATFPSITPSASCLLVITFDTFRNIIVDNKANIGLINSHSKSDGSYHYVYFFHQEHILVLGTCLGIQACMVGNSGDPIHL